MNKHLKTVVVVVSVLTVLFLAIVWLSFTGTTAWIGTAVVLSFAAIGGFLAYRGTDPWFETKGTWFEDED